MIQVTPSHISIKSQQTSFDFTIHNNSPRKIYFKIKSNNIEAVAPCSQFGQIKTGQFAKVLVKILVNYSFQLKMAVEYCEVEQNETLRIENWKNKPSKNIIVIYVQRPDIAQTISNRSFRVQNDRSQQKIQRSSIKMMQSYNIKSSNFMSSLENSQRVSYNNRDFPVQQQRQIPNKQQSSSIKRKSRSQMFNSQIKPRYVIQPRDSKQISHQPYAIQENQRMINSVLSKQKNMMTYNPRYQVAVNYSVIILGSMLFFGLGYLWGILGG